MGNTLLLHGRTFSSPFRITAIGDHRALSQSLASDIGVQRFRNAVASFGLSYQETVEGDVPDQTQETESQRAEPR